MSLESSARSLTIGFWIALVLSLPDSFPNRSLLISMVFSVVLFTVVVQGSLLEPLLRAMGLTGEAPRADRRLDTPT